MESRIVTSIDDIVRLMKEAGIARHKTDSLAPDQSLADQGLDSYDRMSLLSEIEEHFDIDLPNDLANRLNTLDDIVNHLNQDS